MTEAEPNEIWMVLAVLDDLIFQSKLKVVAQQLGT